MIQLTGSEALSTISVSVFGLTYAISSIIAGFIHSIHRRELNIISYSIIGMFLSMILFFTWNPYLFILGRGLIGFFESFVFVGYIGVLLTIFKGHEEGTYAIGKFFSIMGLGLVLGPLLGAYYVKSRLYILSFPVSMLLTVLAYILVRRGASYIPSNNPSRNRPRFSLSPPKFGFILSLAIFMILVVGSVDGVIQSRSVIWFDKLGVDPALGGVLMTIYYLFTIGTEVFVPYLYKKIRWRVFIYLLGVTFTALMMCIFYPISRLPNNSYIYLLYLSTLAFVYALDIGIISPLGTERLVRSFGDNYLIGSGFVNTIWSFSYFITPSILGYIGTSAYTDTILLAAINIIVMLLGLILLSRRGY